MDLYRNTYVEIDLESIEKNVQKICHKFKDYEYYFGVVKADCYGHHDLESIKAMIRGGCNYLAVATLDEALRIREKIESIPILCLGVIPEKWIPVCIEKQITITISSFSYLMEVKTQETKGLKAHLKINTGMNRLGISSQEEMRKVLEELQNTSIMVEGIYSHIYDASKQERYEKQIQKLEEITKEVDLTKIPIIHMSASEALVNYPKPKYINGCRLGIIMYGFSKDKELELQSTFTLQSEVIQINELEAGDTVGYNGTYQAQEKEKIAVIPIGYADGMIRKNTGREVFIQGKRYPIVGNICMDMLFVKIDNTIAVHDKVTLLKDTKHIEEVAHYLDTIPYEILCGIGPRVPRIYKQK